MSPEQRKKWEEFKKAHQEAQQRMNDKAKKDGWTPPESDGDIYRYVLMINGKKYTVYAHSDEEALLKAKMQSRASRGAWFHFDFNHEQPRQPFSESGSDRKARFTETWNETNKKFAEEGAKAHEEMQRKIADLEAKAQGFEYISEDSGYNRYNIVGMPGWSADYNRPVYTQREKNSLGGVFKLPTQKVNTKVFDEVIVLEWNGKPTPNGIRYMQTKGGNRGLAIDRNYWPGEHPVSTYNNVKGWAKPSK